MLLSFLLVSGSYAQFQRIRPKVLAKGNVNFLSTHQTKFNLENVVTLLQLESPVC